MSKSYEQESVEALDNNGTWMLDTGKPYVVEESQGKDRIYEGAVGAPFDRMLARWKLEAVEPSEVKSRIRAMAVEFLADAEADAVDTVPQALGSLPLRQ